MANGEDLTPEQLGALLNDIAHEGRTRPIQLRQWTTEARDYTKLVAEGDSDGSERACFWIRVYGLLTEVRRDLATRLETIRTAAEEAGVPLMETKGLELAAPPVFQALSEIVALIDQVTGTLVDDELTYLEYRRHVECHVFQDSYRLLMRGGRIREYRNNNFKPTQQPIEEVSRALRTVLRSHTSEIALAENFASRLLDPMDALLARILPFTAPE